MIYLARAEALILCDFHHLRKRNKNTELFTLGMWNNTLAILDQDPGSLLPKRKDRFMIKEGTLHGADTRQKAVQCGSEVEAVSQQWRN